MRSGSSSSRSTICCGRLPGDRLAADRAVRAAGAGEEQAEVVVDLGDGADRRPRVAVGRLLVDRDRRRQALDEVDVGLVHLPEELPGVGRQRLDVAALALGEDRVEGQAGLARPGQAGEHDEAVAGQFELDVLEVVLAGTTDDEVVMTHARNARWGHRQHPHPWTPAVASGHGPDLPRRPRRGRRHRPTALLRTARALDDVQRPVAVRGLDPRPRADPRGPQRRRPGRPGALRRRRHRRDDVHQPRGPRRRHRGRGGPARPPSWSTTSSAPRAALAAAAAPARPRAGRAAPGAHPRAVPRQGRRTSRSCGCASWSSTTSTCWPASASATSTPSVQRLLLDEEVRRLRACRPPARPHPAHPGRRRVDGRCGHGIRRRVTAAPCSAGSAAA